MNTIFKHIININLLIAIIFLTSSCDILSSEGFKNEGLKKRDPFKFTVQTNIPNINTNVKILVAINSGNNEYPIDYDLDCDGDGTFEYTGLTESHNCIYKKNSGNHQIWIRGNIPGLFLCARHTPHYIHNRFPPEFYGFIVPLLIDMIRDLLMEPRDYEICDVSDDYECNFPVDVGDNARNAVVSIDSWGDVEWKTMFGFAAECNALRTIPENDPNLSKVTDLSYMFDSKSLFNKRFK